MPLEVENNGVDTISMKVIVFRTLIKYIPILYKQFLLKIFLYHQFPIVHRERKGIASLITSTPYKKDLEDSITKKRKKPAKPKEKELLK